MNKKIALITLILLLSGIQILHFLILIRIIPYEIVWSGRINTIEEMLIFESVSSLINLFILTVISIKYSLYKKGKPNKLVDRIIWGVFAYFVLNTIGNLFAQNNIELVVGTSLSSIMALLCLISVRKK